ncbi:MAG: hypothetical protein IJ877_05225 [Candidatus Gastranaerophilales bacterium]|nr:hypothetical protein [Candidatus Gastranaerophilales bacterium]
MKIPPIIHKLYSPLNNKQNTKASFAYYNEDTLDISFQAKMKELYQGFSFDVLQYISSHKNISIQEIEGIVKKYSNDTNVEDISTYDKPDIRQPKAMVNIPFDVCSDDNNLYIQPMPKTLYLAGFKTPTLEAVVDFTAKLLHEMTHIFQSEADDRMNAEKLCKKYFQNGVNPQKVQYTSEVMDSVFIKLEYIMTQTYLNTYNSGYKRKEERQKAFLDNYNSSIEDFIAGNIALGLVNEKLNSSNIDYKMLLDFIVMRSNDEKEAYQNTYDFIKHFIEDDKAHVGLRIEMYDTMAQAVEKIKGNL